MVVHATLVKSNPKLSEFDTKRGISMLESAADQAVPALSHLLLQDKHRQVNTENMRWNLESHPGYIIYHDDRYQYSKIIIVTSLRELLMCR